MIYTCAFTRHDHSHFTSYPFRIQFFDKWISYFYLLDICKKVRLRYLERVRKSEEDINELLNPILLIFWLLLYIPLTLLITCLLNIKSSVCSQNLMVMDWTHIVWLATWIRKFVYKYSFKCTFVIKFTGS